MQNKFMKIWNYTTNLTGFVFIICAVMYVVLFWWNSLSDFIIDERYFDSKWFLIIGLIAGIVWVFKPKNK